MILFTTAYIHFTGGIKIAPSNLLRHGFAAPMDARLCEEGGWSEFCAAGLGAEVHG
jgi:hypothetical protein